MVAFGVRTSDHGRRGAIAQEPRTRCTGEGDTPDEALDDLRRQLQSHIEYDFVPPAEGRVESIVTVTV